MHVIEMQQLQGRQVDAFGSEGFVVSRIAPEAHVVCAQLAEGGRIGRHDAVVDQLCVVLAGRCEVAGADACVRRIGPGGAALWEAGESHEARALTAVTVLLIEAVGLGHALHRRAVIAPA